MSRQQHQGFTLIELVVVIVILGILAVTAAPRFISLAAESEIATLDGLKGALSSGAELVHSKAVIDGVDTGTNTIELNGGTLSIRSGYPRVASSCSNFTGQLNLWLQLDIDEDICSGGADADWFGTVDQNAFHFMPARYSSTSEECYVTYVTASVNTGSGWEDADSPTIVSNTDGCRN